MTIHHDKLAYGKLASTQEDVSEDRLAEMLKKLNGTEGGGETPDGGAPQSEATQNGQAQNGRKAPENKK